MKKQFFRVKQLADQTFLKADKSEVLNHEELQLADHKVEYLRNALQAISKRLPAVGQAACNEVDKRAKKCAEHYLASVLLEQARQEEGECTPLFQGMLRECGYVQQNLTRDFVEHEHRVEEMVSTPIQAMLDNDFANIPKHKRVLTKYMLDKDSASNRYNSTKKEALRDDIEEADSKVEQIRDLLACEMFGLLAKENELASYMLQLLKLQRGYHESALKNLEGIIPELEKRIGDSNVKRVFGTSLREHLRVTGKSIAFPLEICISVLSKVAMSEEGLLRIAGSVSRVKRLKAAIDSGCLTYLIPEYQDVHVLASTLKLYLRELPEPLLTFELYDDWMEAVSIPEVNIGGRVSPPLKTRLDAIRTLLDRLPQENRTNLAYLVQFLAKIAQNADTTKMTSSNIAIVIAPNLLWDQNKDGDLCMGNCATANTLVELFIREVDLLFPDDVSHLVNVPFIHFVPDHHYHMSATANNNNSSTDSSTYNNATTINDTNTLMNSSYDSPKPNMRKKKPAAPPVPPVAPPVQVRASDQNIDISDITIAPSTVDRLRTPSVKCKVTVGTNTDDYGMISSSSTITADVHNSLPDKCGETFNVTASCESTTDTSGFLRLKSNRNILVNAVATQVSAPPPPPSSVTATSSVFASKGSPDCDRCTNFRTVVTHQINACDSTSDGGGRQTVVARPMTATRASILPDERINRSQSMRKSTPSSESDIHYRTLGAKPTVPARPASLQQQKRCSIPISSASSLGAGGDNNSATLVVGGVELQRTQCSVYSVANKQQASIVNLRQAPPPIGHDRQIAEKEKFLGHVPLMTNNATVVNAGAGDASQQRRTATKSSGSHASTPTPKSVTGPPSSSTPTTHNHHPHHHHARTRSDGDIVDLVMRDLPPMIRTCPNKPTEPPPPPPTPPSPHAKVSTNL